MPRYVFLMRAFDTGSMRMLYSGSAGARAQREAIGELGGTVEAQYAVTGNYDVVVIAELPSDSTALAISLAANAGGMYAEALRAYSEAEVDEAVGMFPEVRDAVEDLDAK
jgi:uncharacterized protein with GYD domain